MRPLPAWPTKTFQSPKVATREGFAASSFLSVLALALGTALVVAAVTGASELAAKAATARSPKARRDGMTRRVIDNNPLTRGPTPARGFPAARSGRNSGLPLAGAGGDCNPARG